MEATVSIVVAILLFVAGMFAKDKLHARKEVRRRTAEAEERHKREQSVAHEEYKRRIDRAKRQAEQAIGKRPVTGDHVADLADRVRRHRNRRQRQRNSK